MLSIMGLGDWMRALFLRRAKEEPTASMVLLMRTPFFLGEDAIREPAAKAFGVPYDGSDPMYFAQQSSDQVWLKAGTYLITVLHKWGAYGGKTEDDVEAGAAHLPEEAATFWREQKAWVAFDLQNKDLPKEEAHGVLAKLLLQVADERCCGIFVPSTGLFLANDGTAEAELRRLAKPL